ncbi:PREDICTED: uncharacterized protein LOC108379857 [Rhagoletis zephyria]|uniref:uncharacterized protein LOC108379857 n=1 Tax=Rhagoletis zephyria TaxID=28612 RepID=UPI000811A4D2|nr:PREDICTED: uncharacterized protein LOC108379857 [Rhagoletis zephyria]
MNTQALEAFNNLKRALTSAPVLKHPDFAKRFFVQCDASEYGVGAVLYQKETDGSEKPIAYFSQKLNDCQRNYTTTEKECLAAVMAVKRSSTANNVVADTLSRCIEEIADSPIANMDTLEFESQEYQELVKTAQTNAERLPDLKVEDGLVFKKAVVNDVECEENEWKLWVPESLTSALIENAHCVETAAHGAMREATAANVVKFLTDEIFHKFGVPEIIHSDSGKQFASKQFTQLLHAYGVKHMKTAYYAPQSNAAERVNQSVLAAIRSYLEKDHREWDLYLSEIECALRSAVQSATGVSPYFALFEMNMFTNGADYALARKLSSLNDHEIFLLDNSDKIRIMREKIKENVHETYETNAAWYNKRIREVSFRPGQEVYKRNFVLSDFKRNINAKFGIAKALGNNMYLLESLAGKSLGAWHAKDIKQ